MASVHHFSSVSRVAICGGTHGNEMTGVFYVREQQKKKVDKIGSLHIMTVLTNPRAVDVCRRYVETDLNRCFPEAILSSTITDSTPYEVRQAHELNALLGPKGSDKAVDLLIDIHNTTANMGFCFILYKIDWITLHIYKYIKSKMSSIPVRAIQLDIPLADAYSLESVGKHGFSMEFGPQPHGVVRADIFNMVKEGMDHTLTWLQEFNSGTTFEGGEVETYTFVKSFDYPRNSEGELTAVIHPDLQDNDFKLLEPGDPIFQSFSGETVTYEEEALYPFFVNESSYYEKKIAFHLAKKNTFSVPSICVEKK